jgi:hypothetical protein
MPHNPDDMGLPQEATDPAMPEIEIETIQVRPAPVTSTPEAKAFYDSRFYELLEDLDVGPFESQAVTRWFWKESHSWPTQDFDKYARYRIRRFIRETRRRADATTVVSRLFDKARSEVSFSQAIDAVTLLAQGEPMPGDIIAVNGSVVFLDLTQRSDYPRVLKIDSAFLPVAQRLWPFAYEHETQAVIKRVPVGDGVVQPIPMLWLAFWSQHPAGLSRNDLMSVVPENGDPLDWRSENLIVPVEPDDDTVPEEPTDVLTKDGAIQMRWRK